MAAENGTKPGRAGRRDAGSIHTVVIHTTLTVLSQGDSIMSHWKKAFPSKYLQSSELDSPIIVTIASVLTENVGSGDDQESKPVVRFVETHVKGVVLNLTRAEAIATVAGDDDTDRWPGTRVRLSRGWTRYQGKRVSCIVVDAPPPSPRLGAPSTEGHGVPSSEVF